MSKQLVNGVTLEIGENISAINISLSIPVLLSPEDRKKVKNKDIDLGVISFSEATSNLIRQAGEAIRNDLLAKI